MRDLRIQELNLRNFKGVSSFTLVPTGGDIDVFGENATGKTTLFDAFLWLLFDKDSANHKDFGVKTLQPSGEALHGFEHEVEGILSLEGRTVTLRKVFFERWTKKRGSAERTFEGHTTDYFVDGVPVKKAEYTARVAEICDEAVFRLLTDPGYFNQVMKWQDRRAMLVDACGDITDADVVASDKALAKLPEILGKRSLDDHRKVIASRRAEINKELEKLPVRIDEVSQGLPEAIGKQPTVEKKLRDLRVSAQEKHEEKARLEAGGQVAVKRRQLAEAQAELQTIENAAKARADEERRVAQQAAGEISYKIDTLTTGVKRRDEEILANLNTIRRLEGDMDKLRSWWTEIDAETFEKDMEEHDTECPTCGQQLPEEMVNTAREKALSAFNRNKAEALEKNVAEGKELKARAGSLSLENERLREEIRKLEVERDELADKRTGMPEIEPAPAILPTADLTAIPEWQNAMRKIDALKAEITNLGDGNTDALAAIASEIAEIQQDIREQEAALAAFDQVEQGNKRIEELKAREKTLAAEYEELEQQLYLCEQFIRAKVGLLESKINAKFKVARFKLFNELINGGVEECCETTVDGVPYQDLNNGMRINVGLDIIDTLSEHYGFSAPIFVDNAEAVTALSNTRGQLIRLVVSAKDKALRVETKTELKEAVNG